MKGAGGQSPAIDAERRIRMEGKGKSPSQRRVEALVRKVKELRAKGHTVTDVCRIVGLSVATVVKYGKM